MPGQSGADPREPAQLDLPAAVSPEPSGPADAAALAPEPLKVGEPVQLARTLTYLKTADPMPMLRPPDLVDAGEVGVVCERRAGDSVAVRFRRGTFLLAAADLRPALPPGD